MKNFLSTNYFVTFIIFILALFLRTYNLENLFVFTIDEEYLFTQAQTIVEDFHLIWIGLSVSVGFYMGPLMTYITALLIYLFKDPVAGGYLAAFIGSVTATTVFLVGRSLFNSKVGVVAGLLYAGLPLVIFYDQRFWNNTPIPLISLLLFYSLYKAIKNPKWWIMFSFLSGLVFHTNLTLFPYLIVGALLFLLHFKKISLKIILISVFFFLLVYSPLLVFDYFHNWSNITSPFRFRSESVYKDNTTEINKHAKALFNFLGRFYYLNIGSINVDENHWGCTSVSGNNVPSYRDKYSTYTNPPLVISFASLGLIIFFLISKNTWKDSKKRLLGVMILLFVGFFLIFPGGALEYYLLPIFSLLPFIPALVISNFKGIKKYIGYSFLIIVLTYAIFVVINSDSQLGIGSQKRIIEKVLNVVNDKNFELQEKGECRGYAGWRYLFTIYGKTPVKSSIDSTFGWLYKDKMSENPNVKYTVIVFENRAVSIEKLNNIVAEFEEGGFKAYVITN